MNVLKNIFYNLYNWIVSNWRNPVIIILILMLAVTCTRYKKAERRYENQISIVSDSVSEYKNKVGELYAERTINISDIKKLKDGNAELSEELKKLRDNPIVVTKVVTKTVIDPITVHDTVIIDQDGRYSYPVSYSDEWCTVKGNSSFDLETMEGEASFDTISFTDNIWIDLIESGGELSFIAKSENPYSKINNLNGAVISPEKSKEISKRFEKKWILSAGAGATATWIGGKFTVVPGFQLTFGRKLLAF